ncbi:hypothetical protein RB195_019505 [Necator americanus]|uniref:Uncharacterized protein n=1 Tax=Necator americanus TaxID=51031 RepID=A0ABR1CG81_NECAM
MWNGSRPTGGIFDNLAAFYTYYDTIMYYDISALSPEESVMRFKEINSEPRPSAECLSEKKKLRDAWLTSHPKTTTMIAAPTDQSSTLIFAVLGLLAVITLIALVTWAVKRNAVKQQRNRDREVRKHQGLFEMSLHSRTLLLEIED